MPEPCCSSCYDSAFDGRLAQRELREYRRKGPGRASRAIAEALGRKGTEGRTVLDIGGGVGAVHQQLLARGAARVTDVDASRAYLEAARAEAERVGLADRVRFEYGDFVSMAPGIEAADLVALDRVVCCYGDVDALVGLAAARTRRRLAITIPPDAWPVRAVIAVGNSWYRLTRNAYRAYAHSHERVIAAAEAAGLVPAGPITSVGWWRLLVFERPIRTADAE
jgi:magnesium-protoporphyrin O-methyltransferase